MITVVLVILCAVVLVLAAALYAVLKQQGRMLLRIDQLEQQLNGSAHQHDHALAAQSAEVPQGLEPGTEFPAFRFPDLSGKSVALADFRGRRPLMVHWNFDCGFCDMIAPELAALEARFNQANVALLLLTYGEAPANIKGASEHALNCPILLMKEGETPAPFADQGTPVAYLLDEQGRVDAPYASGADRVLALARAVVEQHGAAAENAAGRNQGEAPAAAAAASHRLRLPGLRGEIGLGDLIKRFTSLFGIKPCVGCERRAALLNRWMSFSGAPIEGLKPGTAAPEFRLPDLMGREVSLGEFRGRKVLLVFTDPQCGACDELAPELVRVHREHERNGLAVVLVTRGDLHENLRKAEKNGFRFPVVIQSKKWTVARQYGTLATPVAYLIGEDGVITSDVAAGKDPILGLVHRAERK